MTERKDHASGGRHAGREVALQVLYALDLGETGPRDARVARAASAEIRPAGPRSATPSSAVAAAHSSAAGPSSATLHSRPASFSEARLAPRSSGAARALVRYAAVPPAGPSDHSQAATSGATAPTVAEPTEPAEETLVVDPLEASGTAFDRITEHFSVPGSAIDFARELVAGVAARAAELDELVGQHARNWRVSRMAAVDRNVLRLAAYELRDTETPVAVVIDEAVDLARRFGSETSPSFVNGILDAVAREVRIP